MKVIATIIEKRWFFGLIRYYVGLTNAKFIVGELSVVQGWSRERVYHDLPLMSAIGPMQFIKDPAEFYRTLVEGYEQDGMSADVPQEWRDKAAALKRKVWIV